MSIHVYVVQSHTLTHHWWPAEAGISSNEAPRGTWLALIWLRLVMPGPGPAVSMQRTRWKGWWTARYMKGRMRESGFMQPSHLGVLSRANEHMVGSKGAARQAPGISLRFYHTRSLRRAKHSTDHKLPLQYFRSGHDVRLHCCCAAVFFFFSAAAKTSCLHPLELFRPNTDVYMYEKCLGFFSTCYFTVECDVLPKTGGVAITHSSLHCYKNKNKPARTGCWALLWWILLASTGG